jgi:hypothetical protein
MLPCAHFLQHSFPIAARPATVAAASLVHIPRSPLRTFPFAQRTSIHLLIACLFAEERAPYPIEPDRENVGARASSLGSLLSAGVTQAQTQRLGNRLSVWDHVAAPSTSCRVRRKACGTPEREPTHRTNGALAGHPAAERRLSPTSPEPLESLYASTPPSRRDSLRLPTTLRSHQQPATDAFA